MNIENLHKLATREDSLGIHKIFGSIVLIHYLYRFTIILKYNTMFFISPLDLYLVGIHGILSLSSLIFKISNHRHNNKPMIYPELRLHSIIFAMRSIVSVFLVYFKFPIYYRMGVCFVTMIAADIVTFFLAKGTTIRNMPYSNHMNDHDRKKIKYHYSRSQVGATLLMLGTIENCFSPLLAIQLAAFLMTLVRKNIIKGHSFHVGYSLSLWITAISFLSSSPEWIILVTICNNFFSLLRFEFNWNKYILWSLTFGIYLSLENYKSYFNIPKILGFNSHFFNWGVIIFYISKNVISHPSLWKK